jgi:hypothetical protein
MPYLDTPNSGGEYKVWLTPLGAYDGCKNNTFGFCESETKTDNFKVLTPEAALLVACKHNSGIEDLPPIAFWPMTATGVDGSIAGSEVNRQTNDIGCVSFTISTFPAGTITLTEGLLEGNWTKTDPADGEYPRVGGAPAYTVNGMTVTSTDFRPGDILVIDFGNKCAGCSVTPQPFLVVTKDAYPAYKIDGRSPRTWTRRLSTPAARARPPTTRSR